MRISGTLLVGVAIIGFTLCTGRTGAMAAGEPTIIVGGIDVSPTSTYTSVGVIASLRGDLNDSGPLVRVWGDRLTYDFQALGQRIGATSWGHSLSLGYQAKDAVGSTSVYAGIDTRSTALSPGIVRSSVGTHTGARFEIDSTQSIGSFVHVGVIGSVTTANHDYWTRAELMTGRSDTVQFGPQLVVQGNSDYHGTRYGIAANNIRFGTHRGISLGVGTQRINGSSGIYTGLSFVIDPRR